MSEQQQPPAIARLSITFLADGTMQVQGEGVRASHAWAAAELARNLGDKLWNGAAAPEPEPGPVADGRILVPQARLTPVR